MTPSRFNIRVYGLWIQDEKLLVNEEWIQGRHILKFPGGGLELGEGTIDGLKREWREELGLSIEARAHFYTTDFFQASAFDNSQVLSIYYRVQADASLPIRNLQPNERSFWLPLAALHEDSFTLPIDRIVGRMLLREGTDV